VRLSALIADIHCLLPARKQARGVAPPVCDLAALDFKTFSANAGVFPAPMRYRPGAANFAHFDARKRRNRVGIFHKTPSSLATQQQATRIISLDAHVMR
jgi:hypothetical protein